MVVCSFNFHFSLSFFYFLWVYFLSHYYSSLSIYLFWLLHSCWRTWIRPRQRSCVTILASVSWRGVSWSQDLSLGLVSGTSVFLPTRLSAQWTSTASYSQRWVYQPVLEVHCSLWSRHNFIHTVRLFVYYTYLCLLMLLC